jgi:hypothetical protein
MTLCLLSLAGACGGESKQESKHGDEAVPDAGSACVEPPLAVPDTPPFEPPPGQDHTYAVTLRNGCAEAVWPAWRSAGGLDNTDIETELWLPLPSGTYRTVTAYGGVRDIGFWGRTACRFDRHGRGGCQTGDCGNLVCSATSVQYPESATVFHLFQGFSEGYNLPMLVNGEACGGHECLADLGACSEGAVVTNVCDEAIACTDTCSNSTTPCCRDLVGGCDDLHYPNDSEGKSEDLVVTFCPATAR